MRILGLSLLAATATLVRAQPVQLITTIAGTDHAVFNGDGRPASAVSLSSVWGIATDQVGNLYSVAQDNLAIKITPDGILHVVAGNGINGDSGDGGPAVDAALSFVTKVAFDKAAGILYVAQIDGTIRRIYSSGLIDTFPVSGTPNISLNAPALAVGSDGSLYIADTGLVRRVYPDGTVVPVVGHGDTCNVGEEPVTPCGSVDGQVALSISPQIYAIAIGPSDELYLAETPLNRIDMVGPDGIVHTLAQSFSGPSSMAFDAAGNLYVVESGDIAELSTAGLKTVLAYAYLPYGVAVDPVGNVYYSFSTAYLGGEIGVIRQGIPAGIVAGVDNPPDPQDGGLAVNGLLDAPMGVAVDRSGSLYIADTYNNRIRKVSANTISTIAGNGLYEISGDGGPAVNAALAWPSALALDRQGNIYVVAEGAGNVRKISAGNISTITTNLAAPCGVAVDSNGNVFVSGSEVNAQVVNRIEPSGNSTLFAGGGRTVLSPGMSAPATSIALTDACALATDSQNNLYIGSNSSSVDILKVTPTGSASALAASGALSLAVDPDGNIYFGNFENQIQKLDPSGVITTVAGTGASGFTGDGGLADQAAISTAYGVGTDSSGNLFIADTWNNRVREVFAQPPPISITPSTPFLFTAQSQGAPAAPQLLSLTSPTEGIAFTASLPNGVNWLQLNPASGNSPRLIQVTADPTSLAPGSYTTTITINAPYANPSALTVKVIFTVTQNSGPSLSIDHQNLSFSFTKSGSPQAQKITVSNTGSGALNFTASTAVTTPAGGKWLAVSPASGQATPASPSALAVTADPTGLNPGTYGGTVTVSGAGSTLSVPVTMTISSLDQVILLSQTGLSFTAVAQGGVVPPQTFAVRNVGTGVVSWTVSTSTLPAGLGWLQVMPTSGSSDAAQNPPAVTVSVNAAGLGAGIYYGLVQVNAPAAANSPQVVTVFLQVLAAGSDAAEVLDQGSMLFTAVTGGDSAGSQTVSVYNITASARSFRSAVSADPGLSVVTLPTDATLDPQNPTRIVVQPFTSGLASGVYNATVTLQFSDGRVLRVNVKVIVSSTGGGSGPSPAAAQRGTMAGPLDGSSCTPTKLVPALISLADSFELPTGLPVNLGVYVKDDCGTPVESGSVTATFSTGGSAPLLPANGGLWQGQWLTQNGALSTASVKLHAQNAGLVGDQQVTGNLLALEQPPAFEQNGIAAVFGGSANAPIAPGSVIAIYGSQLAADTGATTGSPLPGSWLGTQAFISGGSNVLLALPLYYVSPGQVNAIVPYEVQTNVPLQLLVERGSAASQPVSVNVAAAGPALYGGPGAVTDYPASGAAPYTVTASAPAHAGDYLVFYGLGFGAVTPVVADGGVPGGLSQVTGAQVQIGSQTAVPVFAGLTSQYPGLYQVNVVIPAGTGTGSAVPVTVTIGGQSSLPITVAIQ